MRNLLSLNSVFDRWGVDKAISILLIAAMDRQVIIQFYIEAKTGLSWNEVMSEFSFLCHTIPTFGDSPEAE
ncbi:hypothetical protein GZ78_09415 [Endozoicomonas numazuensis]|uniref:Uncharacterized protein n=1 Tax=Endozoicomonas numazuensis TaxID=1137799 RepID=A0A081NHD5_9GAMM|nr:hypothetical protein GZ78_09415 [Endozoicomonas numazuensis]